MTYIGKLNSRCNKAKLNYTLGWNPSTKQWCVELYTKEDTFSFFGDEMEDAIDAAIDRIALIDLPLWNFCGVNPIND